MKPPSRAARTAAIAVAVVVHVMGVASFLYPFFLGELDRAGEAFAHAGEAPLLFAALAGLLIALAASAARAGALDAKHVALLGILAGLNAVLRFPGGFGGGSLMFALPVLCGYAFGPSFGFMLGAASFAASAVITGGVGPWVPFQMWGLGWIGAGAGLVRAPVARARSSWTPIAALAVYGWIAGHAFGAILNLWFWPFLGGAADLSWVPGIGATEAVARYWRFYLVTSLPWDAGRAVVNALLILAVGRPVLRLLERFRARLTVRWAPVEPSAAG